MDPSRKYSPNIEKRSPMISYQYPDQTTRRTSFFDLPFEIRDQIYSELIPRHIEIIAWHICVSGEFFDRINAFALVSHQFRTEVLRKLHAQSTIRLKFCYYDCMNVPKLCTGLPVQRLLIHRVLEIRKVAETEVSTVKQRGLHLSLLAAANKHPSTVISALTVVRDVKSDLNGSLDAAHFQKDCAKSWRYTKPRSFFL